MSLAHCEDNSTDRKIGAYWEKQFGRMAVDYGHTFTPHQFGKGRIAASAWNASGHVVLPDITIWSGPGEHHEVKHKAPTSGGCFGLEAYRLDSLLSFAAITLEPVYYTIHDWKLAGARDGRQVVENQIEHWVVCNVAVLQRHRGQSEWGDSWVNGQKSRVPILYWPTALFKPLVTLWRRGPGTSTHACFLETP